MSLPLRAMVPFFTAAAAAPVETNLFTATLTAANISGQGTSERGYNAPSGNGSLSSTTFTYNGIDYTVGAWIGRNKPNYSDILVLIVKDGVTSAWPKSEMEGLYADVGINNLPGRELGTVEFNNYTTTNGTNGRGFTWWEGPNNRRGFGIYQKRPAVAADVYVSGQTYDVRLYTISTPTPPPGGMTETATWSLSSPVGNTALQRFSVANNLHTLPANWWAAGVATADQDLRFLSIQSTGILTIRFGGSSSSDLGDNLKDSVRMNATIKFTNATAASVTITGVGGSDTEEPYVWTPTEAGWQTWVDAWFAAGTKDLTVEWSYTPST